MQNHPHGQEYQTLLNNIPGGVQQCLNDEAFTLVEVNQGFLDLFGYSRQEIMERFADRYIEMLHPADRPQLLAEAAQQLGCGEKATFQYRVRCKDGSYKWVMDNAQLIYNENGEERIFCVLTDITEQRNIREEQRLSLELHQIIMDQATDILFVWDFAGDTMSYSSNWEKKFGYLPTYHGLSRPDTVYQNIHPDDIPALREAMTAAKNGSAFSTVEARVQNKKGRYLWCRFRATDQYDEFGSPLKAVGVITDIDEEKRKLDDLKKRAELDALTGLYNRAETEARIRRHLAGQPNGLCALFVIDIDNFKAINDGLGHLLGDAVLTELGAEMKKLTRQSDVVGRIGGDEFAIFLKDFPTVAVAKKKAEGLLEMFRSLFRREKRPVEVTCSIGIAIHPQDGADFPSLYHSADLALYQAKSRGRNQYAFFGPQSESPVGVADHTALGADIDSDQRGLGAAGELTDYVFQTLYSSCDLDQAIGLILEIVGKRFDVSRAYIFENSEDGLHTSNTYEWCGEGVAPEKENLQHCSLVDPLDYREFFKESPIFYCRNIKSLHPALTEFFGAQKICSTLQSAMYYGAVLSGFIGFDECTGVRMWTKEEVGTLSVISQMLATFLQRKRIGDHDRQLADRLSTILDAQDAYIYAIGRNSYELLYINRKVRLLDPKAETGMTCYGAFFGRSAPCETCPLTGGAGEIYNPQYGVWTKVKAAPMKWGDIDAYLLSCFDVTEYKKAPGCRGEKTV
ncbi:sensor domain-containing diguanylate cyclase [Bittarella massiliensis (ex Durand et al. 2017)]|uniref:sensor domain-containing diguanylate cyclase n=1 Tax=Bittarella massiliensis (ex Durand et al. 2017) TaxID=1720313 RepID=UPI001AA103C6|nr:diguanylate cyclase [Bittarella massiliensis (ex Durand et al. 2017)]MBO1678515.1 diguanylate cyclase [Bittarella massiliensis (ex Durand et al. 2017)]